MLDPRTGDNLIHRVNVGDSLTRITARRPHGTAVVDGTRRFTYRELNAWVNRVANALDGWGYRRGDALGLASANSVEFLVTYYACAKLGVVCVPVNLGWRPHEVAHVLGYSGARGIVVEAQPLPAIAPAVLETPHVTDVVSAPAPAPTPTPTPTWLAADRHFRQLADGASYDQPVHHVEDRDPITYLYTSVSRPSPRASWNHPAIYLESTSVALEARFAEDDRFVAMMPRTHTAERKPHFTAAVMVGATLYVERGFAAGRVVELIENGGSPRSSGCR